jgi:hypothetical protein
MDQCIPTLEVGIPEVPQGVPMCHCVGKLFSNDTSLILKPLNLEVNPKNYQIRTTNILKLPLKTLESIKKFINHFDVAPTRSCRVYYREEGGVFPQIQVVTNLVNLN